MVVEHAAAQSAFPFVGLPGKESVIEGRFVSPKKVRKQSVVGGRLMTLWETDGKESFVEGRFPTRE